MSKETLIAELTNFGKQPNKTWLSYAKDHSIKIGSSDDKRAKAANDIWRAYVDKKMYEEYTISREYDIKKLTEEDLFEDISKEEHKYVDKLLIERLTKQDSNIHQKQEDIKDQPDFTLTSTNIDKTWHETKETAKVEITSPNEVKNVEELIKICNIDTNIWEADSFWQSCKSNKWNISASFRKKKIDDSLELQKNIILDELKESSPKRISPYIKGTDSNQLLELSIFDLHIGKLAWDEETGENYDSYIACKRYKQAVSDLVGRVDKSKIGRILLPVGNDMINVDNKSHTTTGGTPQSCDSRFTKMIRVAKNLLVEVIDGLSLIAPVDIIIVPGNHDSVTMFTLGEILDAFYHNTQNVVVYNSPAQRKYYQYGVNGLMFTHGNEEKHNDLGLIFATEQPKLWADTKYREAHLGHFHKVKSTKYININEETGFKVRILPSLSGTDAWHYNKGYISNKSAEAYLWDYEKGLQATFIHNSI